MLQHKLRGKNHKMGTSPESRWVQKTEEFLDKWEKSPLLKILGYLFLCGYILSMGYGVARGQTTTAGLSIIKNSSSVKQGDVAEFTVRLDSATRAYYFESEVTFDQNTFSFLDVEPDTLLQGSDGISVGDMLNSTTLGVSASRTSGEATGPGNLLRIRFSVKADADTGKTVLKWQNSILKDSAGTDIPVLEPQDATIRVLPAITQLGLMSGSQTIHEAQQADLTSYAFAHQVTNTTSPSDSLRVWMGLNANDTDPSTWAEQQWRRADIYSSQNSGAKSYKATFGPALEVGTWYYAVRYQLNGRAYKYGGFATDTGAVWDGTTSTSGVLTVNERPPYQYELAGWDFDDRDLMADGYITSNRSSTIDVFGAQVEGFDEKDQGYTLATDSWHTETGADSLKFIKTQLSTAGFQNIRVSSVFKGTSSSARDFKLQYSLDNSTWIDVSGGNITVGDNWTDGELQLLQLPVETDDRTSLMLRWLRVGDTRVDGTQGISTQGKVRIDDIKITGNAKNPASPTVWPGDADNDGLVTSADVLPLGTWWGLTGPDRILRDVSWSGLESLGWYPIEATYADTDGSGVVDHSDLEAIGLNYGRSSQQVTAQSYRQEPAKVIIPALSRGEEYMVTLRSINRVALSGLAVDLSWNGGQDGISGRELEIEPVIDENNWLYDWKSEQQLLEFKRKSGNEWSAAWVHKGWTEPGETNRLIHFNIKSLTDWTDPLTLEAGNIHIARPDNSTTLLEEVELVTSTTTGVDEGKNQESLPRETQLFPNHPNPFNPTTNIQYQLARTGKVTLKIYNLLGKQVATLLNDKHQTAGTYNYQWNASGMSSGIYLYTLETSTKKLTRKMLLMK